jgi:hypothetical protein
MITEIFHRSLFRSVAESHHVEAALAPGTNFNTVPFLITFFVVNISIGIGAIRTGTLAAAVLCCAPAPDPQHCFYGIPSTNRKYSKGILVDNQSWSDTRHNITIYISFINYSYCTVH